jgi:hypothetical protein
MGILSKLIAILREKGFPIYTRPYELNLVGVRSDSTVANTFNDELYVMYKDENKKWHVHYYKITTDPGTYWLENPSSPKGTAILAEGSYVSAYAIGLHRGKYKALVQVKPVTVFRDYDRSAILDFNNGTKDTGLFGINIHHALSTGRTKYIDKFSAGCQVFQDIDDFNEFMNLCEKHAALYGNHFTYTLVDKRAIARLGMRRLAYGTAFILSLLISIIWKENKK